MIRYLLLLILVPSAMAYCIDSDFGVNVSVAGIVDWGLPETLYTQEDMCSDAATVLEWYCSEDEGLSTLLSCAYGCEAGRCVPPPEHTACNDGKDGDGDGLIDFPYDPGCACLSDPDEHDTSDDGELCTGQQPDGCMDAEDAFPTLYSADSDGDGIIDDCDVCPSMKDPGQFDSDGDGMGDACTTECTNECVLDGFPFCAGGKKTECVLQNDGCTDVIISEGVC